MNLYNKAFRIIYGLRNLLESQVKTELGASLIYLQRAVGVTTENCSEIIDTRDTKLKIEMQALKQEIATKFNTLMDQISAIPSLHIAKVTNRAQTLENRAGMLKSITPQASSKSALSITVSNKYAQVNLTQTKSYAAAVKVKEAQT